MNIEAIKIERSGFSSMHRIGIIGLLIPLCCLAMVLQSCGAGMLGSGDPRLGENMCLNGVFSDGEVSMIILANASVVTMSGWKEPGHVVPWETLSFTGLIGRDGTATGEIMVFFPPEMVSPTELSVPQTTVPDIRFTLTNGATCELSNDLSFSLMYNDPDGMSRGDLTGRTLTRRP